MTQPHWKQLRDESVLKNYQARVLKPLTPNQEKYFRAVENSTLTICTGPAGTGKSYLAAGLAARMFRDGKVRRIVLTRPLAECDEETGTLPGTLMEKVSDSMRPMLDCLGEFFSGYELEKLFREEQLQVVPLAKMRGLTFKEAFVALDEAQNATMRQLRMFLTRLGKGSKFVVNGDHTQSDLPHRGRPNSLLEVLRRLSVDSHPSVSIVRLTAADVVRHELISWLESRLAGPAAESGPYYSVMRNDWEALACPGCGKRFWFERWVALENLLVGCPHCGMAVELEDELGLRDPVVVEEERPDYVALDRKPE